MSLKKFAEGVSKYGTHCTYGIMREDEDVNLMMKMYLEFMIWTILSNDLMSAALTEQELQTLIGALTIKTL